MQAGKLPSPAGTLVMTTMALASSVVLTARRFYFDGGWEKRVSSGIFPHFGFAFSMRLMLLLFRLGPRYGAMRLATMQCVRFSDIVHDVACCCPRTQPSCLHMV
ncbi:hypothetical protein BDY21DRAFT_184494 [Lineolata rhizophorae]|uniref:Uncharacterized protein n=1 Tax=Lineolata rhizophorae TaxID=578093 RepID=A0A6A6P804_9PEZI|nr:hypothetical protein BDY21DRAFT_184494 [Lineolata rhizophorae]